MFFWFCERLMACIPSLKQSKVQHGKEEDHPNNYKDSG